MSTGDEEAGLGPEGEVEAAEEEAAEALAKRVDHALMERAKTFTFVALWWHWAEIYLSEMSVHAHGPYGYRGGFFRRGGSRKGQHHPHWPAFFNSMAAHQMPYTSIHALFCYLTYPSSRHFIETGGSFIYP